MEAVPKRYLAFGLLFALVTGLLGYFIHGYFTKEREERGRATPPVIVAVRELAKLEAVSYHLERVVEVSEEKKKLYGLVKAKDTVLLVVAADVRAGVDLAKLEDSDIQVDEANHSVRLLLPPPKILSVSLDEERTFVHSRSTDLLAERSEDLEQKARRRAVKDLRSAALKGGILEEAKRSAEKTLHGLLRGVGFQSIRIEWQDEE